MRIGYGSCGQAALDSNSKNVVTYIIAINSTRLQVHLAWTQRMHSNLTVDCHQASSKLVHL